MLGSPDPSLFQTQDAGVSPGESCSWEESHVLIPCGGELSLPIAKDFAACFTKSHLTPTKEPRASVMWHPAGPALPGLQLLLSQLSAHLIHCEVLGTVLGLQSSGGH